MNIKSEYDASEERWRYYQERYPKLSIRVEDVVYNNGRGRWSYGSVDLSGDCFFNFNDEKIKAFIKNVSCDDSTIKRLQECAKKHHSNENCVLMPVTGGMNNVKGKIYYRDTGFAVAGVGRPTNKCYDRPDTFIYYLNEFFVQRKKDFKLLNAGEYLNNSIFKAALQSFNFADLYVFMDGFENIYDYCEWFYGIDKVFVDRMINEGKNPIVRNKDLNRYMQLAYDFWKIQADIIKKI